MKITMVSPKDLRPYENNPRFNDGAVAAVAESIRNFGFRQPIVVDHEKTIIIGHTRWKAALQLELDKVPVHIATGLSETQVQALRIADNRSSEIAEWDYEKLRVELLALEQAGAAELTALGFDDAHLKELMAQPTPEGLCDPNDVPEPPDAPVTQPGDLWLLGNHRLLCGDSSIPERLDRLLEGAPIHLVNTDPPYNVKVEPRSNNAIAAGLSSFEATHHQGLDVARDPKKSKGTTRKLRAKDRPLANDFVSDAAFDALLAAWFGNIARVLVPGGSFYIWGGYANCANYPPVLAKLELYFSQAIIWVKEHPVLTRKNFMGNHEWCFHGWKLGAAHRWFGPMNVPDTWDVSPVVARKDGKETMLLEVPDAAKDLVPSDVWRVKKINPQAMVHLTEKPVELAKRAMEYSSRPGENVLDLFGGSGSTLIAAEQCGRSAFLMELDALYCDVIVHRWEKFTGRQAERVPAR